MVIHRKNGEVLEANLINGELVTLKQFKNNSAPHSKCTFFKMTPGKVECTFPKDLIKKCQIQKGTHNGWDTTEYVKTYIGAEDYMCEEIEEIKEPEKATGIEEKQPVEGLEEAAGKYASDSTGFIDMTAYNAFKAGAEWMAKHK